MRCAEVKRHLDGRIERFDCRLVLHRPNVAVLRFDHRSERRAGGFVPPRRSRTFGFFWRRRPYLLYRIEGPNGALIAHRFDVVEDVRLERREVSYTDLLLDLWVGPQGSVLIEDEDEALEHVRRGLLSTAQQARIERTRALLLRRWPTLVREAAAILGEASRS